MATPQSYEDSMTEANRTRNEFSSYRGAVGEAGYRDRSAGVGDVDVMASPGESVAISPEKDMFEEIYVGCAWNLRQQKSTGFLGRLLGLQKKIHVDLDLGCLYEMQNGAVGALQSFGGPHGTLKADPYILLSHDERSGDKEGDDEHLQIDGARWQDIKRCLIYAYIYSGAPDWSTVRPHIQLLVKGNKPLVVKPKVHLQQLRVCAVALLENVRNGLQVTNLTEYFPGQAELDRAYGFGLEWTGGAKQPRAHER